MAFTKNLIRSLNTLVSSEEALGLDEIEDDGVVLGLSDTDELGLAEALGLGVGLDEALGDGDGDEE